MRLLTALQRLEARGHAPWLAPAAGRPTVVDPVVNEPVVAEPPAESPADALAESQAEPQVEDVVDDVVDEVLEPEPAPDAPPAAAVSPAPPPPAEVEPAPPVVALPLPTASERAVAARLADDARRQALEPLVEQLVAAHAGAAAVLLLTGNCHPGDDGLLAAALAQRLAQRLAERADGPTLLIDAAGPLTNGFAATTRAGLTDLSAPGFSPVALATPTATAGLRFLPRGRSGRLSASDAQLCSLAGAARQAFARTVIAGGPPDDELVRRLAPACDAVYLHVVLGETPLAALREDVERMRRRGVRLAGCLTLGAVAPAAA